MKTDLKTLTVFKNEAENEKLKNDSHSMYLPLNN